MDPDRTILSQYHNHFRAINEELGKSLISRVALIKDIGNHSLLAEGKRLRPLFFVLSCHLCGYQGKDIYRLSTILEYMHAGSLLHDDVVDNAETRRKKPSANKVWGNRAAVLEGDFLYVKSSSIALSANNLTFLKKLTETATQMTEGQILELVHSHDWDMCKEKYLEIITAKTAVLISAACACGAIISGAEKGAVACLGEFGLNLGIAFQLVDDLLDYASTEEVLGKPVGKDLKEGKITLPLIYTLPQIEASERKRLQGLFKNGRAKESDYRDLIEFVRGNGALGRIREEARSYVSKAASSLKPFPESPAKTSLLELGRYVIQRSH